jgi:hypothetical protein
MHGRLAWRALSIVTVAASAAVLSSSSAGLGVLLPLLPYLPVAALVPCSLLGALSLGLSCVTLQDEVAQHSHDSDGATSRKPR